MTERPIIFSGAMVRAILKGRKTQTRRVIKPQPHGILCRDSASPSGYSFDSPSLGDQVLRCPYGAPGDRIWVRETWRSDECACVSARGYRLDDCVYCKGLARNEVTYRATVSSDVDAIVHHWRSPIHMPRWASRLTLELTEVRVQRLQEISDEDAFAEGIQLVVNEGQQDDGTARGAFRELWDSINAHKYPWSFNPWCWCVSFSRSSS